MRFVLLLVSSLLMVNPVFSKVIHYETDSFVEIATLYEKLKVDPKTTLMVFDLDNTLITMSDPLGSVGWWDWQYELLKTGNQSDKLFTQDFQQLVRIQNILFQLIKMEVTEEEVIPFLKNTANQGGTLMSLTARGKEHLSATLMQLKDNQFIDEGKLLFQKNGLKLKNNQTSLGDYVNCPQFTREVTYQQGIMFLDGEDKGEALLCAIAQTQQPIQTIVFVDDSKSNTVSVGKAFAHRDDLMVLNILYTKEHAKGLEIQKNPQIQAQLLDHWNQIKVTLNKTITKSNF